MSTPIRTPALMLQGTGSDVGKSVLVAGLCRLFARQGRRVVPFKPQNMSNNAAVAAIPGTADYGEIGRAQWLQALAAGVAPSVHMNPVLLKPQSETGSQVVVQGRVFGTAEGRDYQRLKPQLLAKVLESFDIVCEGADLVLVEGAGSPAEINLRQNDIANMGFARAAGVPVVLVGDIDRGGVIASLVGTHTVLCDNDRAMIAGFLVNKFRGDPRLFDEGLAAVTRFSGWPSLGLVPYLPEAARLPAEDSVALERLAASARGGFRIVVPLLPRIANFDDLDPLAQTPGVSLSFIRPGERLPADADLVVIPGSKSTLGDLAAFRAHGWDRDLRAIRERGGAIIGLCGGYQMLGRRVLDPLGADGRPGEAEGLGLLDIETMMAVGKTVRPVSGVSALGPAIEAYEIHLGESDGPDRARPFAMVDGAPEGAISADGRVFGTYLHGTFTAEPFRRAFLASLGLIAPAGEDYRAGIDAALDAIADRLETSLATDAMLAIGRSRKR